MRGDLHVDKGNGVRRGFGREEPARVWEHRHGGTFAVAKSHSSGETRHARPRRRLLGDAAICQDGLPCRAITQQEGVELGTGPAGLKQQSCCP